MIDEIEVLRERIAELEGKNRDLERMLAASERDELRFRSLNKAANLGFMEFDEGGNLIDISESWLQLMMYEKSQVLGRWFGDFLPSVDARKFPEEYRKQLETEGTYQDRYTILRSDGGPIHTRITGHVVRDEEHSFLTNHWVLFDTTEIIKASDALVRSETKYRLLVDNAPMQIIEIDLDGKIKFLNRMIHLEGDEAWLEKSIFEYIPEHLHDVTRETISRVIEDVEIVDIELPYTVDNGQTHWYQVHIAPVIVSGVVESLVLFLTDITARKSEELALLDDRDWLRHMVQSIPAGAVFIQNDKIEINGRVEEITGYTQEELPTIQVWFETLYTGRVDENIELYKAQKDRDLRETTLREIRTKKGEYRKVEFSGYYDGINEIWLMHDVTERVRAEEALKVQKNLLVQAESIAEMGSFQSDLPDGEIIWSENMYSILGTDEKLSIAQFHDYLNTYAHKNDLEKAKQELQNVLDGTQISFRFRINHSRLGTRHIEVRAELVQGGKGAPKKLIGFVQDITDRVHAEQTLQIYSETLEEMVAERTRQLKDAQDELVRKEKLAFLGEIAGSVSHELRNPLGVISNAVYYLQLVYGESADQQFRDYIEMIMGEVKDVQGIISDMLNLTKASSPKREPVQISELIHKVLERKPPPPSIQLIQEYADDLPEIFVDERQIRQVIMNLVRNAYDAMPDGGDLTFRVFEEDQMVCLTIQDTGVGIPSEHLSQLFEPLFTTKSSGTGLGLTVVQKLVQTNEAEIEVESEVGKGTIFTVRLPRSE